MHQSLRALLGEEEQADDGQADEQGGEPPDPAHKPSSEDHPQNFANEVMT